MTTGKNLDSKTKKRISRVTTYRDSFECCILRQFVREKKLLIPQNFGTAVNVFSISTYFRLLVGIFGERQWQRKHEKEEHTHSERNEALGNQRTSEKLRIKHTAMHRRNYSSCWNLHIFLSSTGFFVYSVQHVKWIHSAVTRFFRNSTQNSLNSPNLNFIFQFRFAPIRRRFCRRVFLCNFFAFLVFVALPVSQTCW